jgi:hypothetical protein
MAMLVISCCMTYPWMSRGLMIRKGTLFCKFAYDTVDGCEILHQLVDDLSYYNPTIYSVS